MKKDRLVYAATPSRNNDQTEKIMQFISDNDFLPFHPFPAFPFKYYEGNPKVGRDRAMRACFRGIKMCDEFWLFGISDGTLREAAYTLKLNKNLLRKVFRRTKKIDLHLEFDPKWQDITSNLTPIHGKTLRRLGLLPKYL